MTSGKLVELIKTDALNHLKTDALGQAKAARGVAKKAGANAPAPMHFEDLPDSVKKEAELTISDDWHLNYSADDLAWERKRVRISEMAEQILEDGAEGSEDFMEHAEALGKDIRKNGQREPIVIGPCGLEGNHRVVGAYLAGIKTLDAVVSRYAPVLAEKMRRSSAAKAKPPI